MKTKHNLTGIKFGRLLPLWTEGVNKSRKTLWKCRCECGADRLVDATKLISGHTRSCGCLKVELGRKRSTKHRMSTSPEYKTWGKMKDRCINPNELHYEDYGGRGIKVCDRWMKFENFYEDMGPKPSPEHSIDRYPDNDGNYEPRNCRWATDGEQARNKRTTRFLEISGERRSVRDWCDHFGITSCAVISRIKRGWSVMDSVTIPTIRPSKLRKETPS